MNCIIYTRTAWDATYDPFGKASITTATVTNNLRFPGQYYDMETGLHYNWHRYYWPEVGRYVEADLWFISYLQGKTALNKIESIYKRNIYSYASNNPVLLIDPTGEVECEYSIIRRNLTCTTKCNEKISCYAESGNNNPADMCAFWVGPIPTGLWSIGIPQNKWAPLTLVVGTNQCPLRTEGFYIHGWGKTEGCIAIKYNICRDWVMNALTRERGGILEVVIN